MTTKFQYIADPKGRSRHSVRAVRGAGFRLRRARSDAPYHVTELICQDGLMWGDYEMLFPITDLYKGEI
jgi:hypothetical protein